MDDNYERYGDEWKAEILKFSKLEIVAMLKSAYEENNAAETCDLEPDSDDIYPCNITSCCKIGPITSENYCPNCGRKIKK